MILLKVWDLCQGHWRTATESGHGRAALVRARARRGWSEGAGARRTRVNWEQVEEDTAHQDTGPELLAPLTSLQRVKKSTDCLHSIIST